MVSPYPMRGHTEQSQPSSEHAESMLMACRRLSLLPCAVKITRPSMQKHGQDGRCRRAQPVAHAGPQQMSAASFSLPD